MKTPTKNITVDITIAAIENPLNLPFLLLALLKPIPPKIHPSYGLINEHTKPAIAIPFFSRDFTFALFEQ